MFKLKKAKSPATASENGPQPLSARKQARSQTLQRLRVASRTASMSIYFWACIVYFIYNAGLLHVDYCNVIYPDIVATVEDECYSYCSVVEEDSGLNGTSSNSTNSTNGTSSRLLSQARLLPRYLTHTVETSNCSNGTDINSGDNCTDIEEEGGTADDDTSAGNDDVTGEPPAECGYELLTHEEIIPDPRCSFDGLGPVNLIYIILGFIQVINSAMFVASWHGFTARGIFDVLAIPDWAFVVSSTTWFVTSLSYTDPLLKSSLTIRNTEMFASVVDAFASAGWIWTWVVTYERIPGRDWTLDDPDLLALVFLQIAAWTYCHYNASILMDPALYDTSYDYVTGDVLYFMSGVFYFLAAMRDAGFMWWAPLAGGWVFAVTHTGTGVVYGAGNAIEALTVLESDAASGVLPAGAAEPSSRNLLSGGMQVKTEGTGRRRGSILSSGPGPASLSLEGAGGGDFDGTAAEMDSGPGGFGVQGLRVINPLAILAGAGNGGVRNEEPAYASFAVRTVNMQPVRGTIEGGASSDPTAGSNESYGAAGNGAVVHVPVVVSPGKGGAMAKGDEEEAVGLDSFKPTKPGPGAKKRAQKRKSGAGAGAVACERAAALLQRVARGWRVRRIVRGWTRVVDGEDVYWYNAASSTSSWYPPGRDPSGEVKL